jgi:hypothetical protein
MSRRGNGLVFNVLAALLVGLSALACACSSLVFFVPALAGPFAGPPPYTLPMPTETPTLAPVFPPTWTFTPVPTPLDTPTPFVFSTLVPDTPTITMVPLTQTRRVTATPAPTVRFTPSPFKFDGKPAELRPSPINACAASYIFGTVADLEGKPLVSGNLIVHVEGDADIDTGFQLHPGEQFRGNRVEGRSPFASLLNDPSAWSVVINQSGTSAGTWNVWLAQGGQASNKVQVQLGADCVSSSANVSFRQNR